MNWPCRLRRRLSRSRISSRRERTESDMSAALAASLLVASEEEGIESPAVLTHQTDVGKSRKYERQARLTRSGDRVASTWRYLAMSQRWSITSRGWQPRGAMEYFW